MYNVFVKKNLLRIAKKTNSNFEFEDSYFDTIQLEKIIKKLEKDKFDRFLLRTDHPEIVLEDFNKIGEIRVAAGGIVKNSNGQILFIFREGVWDLPKGFVEKGESLEQGAVREVEEETGVSGLMISNHFKTTYHTYRHKGNLVLKISHWFNMSCDYAGELVPQEKEGITIAKWLNEDEVKKALNNTWENIKLLF